MTLNNPLHENFARLIAEGLTATDAYRRLKPHSRHPSALGSRLWSRMEVRVRVAELAEQAMNEQVMPIKQKLKILEAQIRGEIPTKVIRRPNGGSEEVFDMLSALATHGKISGDFLPQSAKPSGPTLNLQFNIRGRNEEW